MSVRVPLVFALLAACAALGALAASCGANDPQSAGPVPSVPATTDGSVGGTETTASEPTPTQTSAGATTPPPTRKVSLQVWFARPEIQGQGTSDPRLFVVRREIDSTPGIGAAALNALLAGPTDQEANADVASVVPSGTKLLGLDIANGTATVDLSSEFESGGGSLSMQMRLAQVVYTLTQFDTVKRVRFQLDGQPVEVFSGEGIVLDKPVTRADYEELLPTILVEAPPVFAEIPRPVTVSGTANVFEANVTVRIVTAGGKELARTFTTATCGTGCRGTFSVSVSYPAQKGAARSGFIVVQDDDAAGQGFPPHQVRIPVILASG